MFRKTISLLTIALCVFVGSNAFSQNYWEEEDIQTINDEQLQSAPYCEGISYSIVRANKKDYIKIYDKNFECIKTVHFNMPSNATSMHIFNVYCLTKGVFTSKNKYEFIIDGGYDIVDTINGHYDYFARDGIYNEDGECIYSLHDNECCLFTKYPPYIMGKKLVVMLGSGYNGDYYYVTKIFTLNKSINTSVTSVVAQQNQSKLYPNPARQDVTLEYDIQGQMQQMQIIDMQGRTVENYLLDPSRKQVKINTSNYKKGVYIYRYGNQSGKFVVE